MEQLRDLLLQVRNRLSSSSRKDQFLEMILSAEESLRLLGTNDDPIKTEELLRGPLNQCQLLRQKIADLHCRHGVLEERDLINIAEKIKGLFSYIRRCPPEIMSEIFFNCVDAYPLTNKPEDTFHSSVRARFIHPDQAPLLLLRICKKWRHIALSTPKLFTQLYLPHGMMEGKEEMNSVLHLFLTCSGSLALDVFLQAKEHYRFPLGKTDMVGAQLSPCFSRIYRIIMPGDLLPCLFPPDSCTNAPALLEFRLYGDRMPASDSQLGRLVAPKLEAFSSPVYVDFDLGGFITFGECLNLFSGRNSLATPHQLFQNSSNMEFCNVLYLSGSLASQLKCDAPIFLPRLRHLSISISFELCIPLLSQLTMPSLRALHLNIHDLYHGHESILGGIISSFISARPSLETLFIGGTIIECEEFQDLLCILPELTTLTFDNCEIRGAFRALVPAHAPDICPKLATLNVEEFSFHPDYSQVDYERDIIDIICSRARSHRSEDPEERMQRCLRHFHLIYKEADFSVVALERIRCLGDEYDIVINLEWYGSEEYGSEHLDEIEDSDESEDSDDGTPSDF